MPNRDLELFHLTRFLDAIGVEPDQPPERPDPPDFIVSLGGRTVGIEHTEFFLSPQPGQMPQQHLHALQLLTLEQARRIFRARGGPALYVRPLFNADRAPRTKQDAHRLAERLAAVVERNGWPRKPAQHTFETWRDLPELHSYSVMESVDGVDELWHGGSFGWVAPVTAEHVQEVLNAKRDKHPRYLEKASTNWLLIVNDSFRGGAACELTATAAAAKYTFPFERSFWFDFPSGHVTEFHR